MVADKMVRTKWYTDKMVADKMVQTKWYGQNGTILYFVYILIQLNSIYIVTYASLQLLLTPYQRHSDVGQSSCVWLNVIVTGMSVFCLHDAMSRFVCFSTYISSDWVHSYIKAQGGVFGRTVDGRDCGERRCVFEPPTVILF